MAIFTKFLFLIIILLSSGLHAEENIIKSLSSAYLKNPKLNAERERAKAVDENLVQASSAFKPTVTISAYKSDTDNLGVTTASGASSPSSNTQTTGKSLTIEQKIFNFNDMYNYEREKSSVQIARYNLQKIEQDVLLESADAYLGTLLAQNKVDIYKDTLNLSEKQVELDKSRLDRGIITIADLAQSESALAAVQSSLLSAENDFLISKKSFKNAIGYEPVDLKEVDNLTLNLPKSLEESISYLQKDNPILKIAEFSLKKADSDYKSSVAELSPTFSLSYNITDYDGYTTSLDKTKQQVAKAQASIPLYQGGKQTSIISQKRALLDGADLDLQTAKNTVDKDAYSAWSSYKLAISNFELSKLRLKASEMAYEGISQEYESGSRSTLEVITSRTALLDSRINFATADKERIISQFRLLSSVGGLTAKNLSLEGKLYDAEGYSKSSWIRHLF
jgi:outer membrane protein